MRQEAGRHIIKQLANNVDVLVENFRPGVMEKWGLGPKVSINYFTRVYTVLLLYGMQRRFASACCMLPVSCSIKYNMFVSLQKDTH